MRGARTIPWMLAAVLLGPAVAVAQIARPSEDVYQQIQNAFLQERFDQVVQLVGLLRANPPAGDPKLYGELSKSGRVWLWYVLSLERLQRIPEALQEIDQLKTHLLAGAKARGAVIDRPVEVDAATSGLWPEVLFWEGEVSRKGYQMVRARRAYQRVLAGFGHSTWQPQAQLGLAFVLFHQQAYDEARRQAQDAQRRAPSPTIARQAKLLEGLSALQLKDFEASGRLLEELLRAAADGQTAAQLAFYLGEARSGQERFADAGRAYLRAMAADPGSSWARLARFGLGWASFQQGQCPESLQIFGAPARADPSWPRVDLWFAQGRCSMAVQDPVAARERFEQILKMAPEHPLAAEAALSLAELFERQRLIADAERVLQPLLARPLTPEQQARAVLQMGALLLAQGRAEEAIRQFEQAARSDDPSLRQAALNGQGDVRFFLGDLDAAARAYEQAADARGGRRDGADYAAYQMGRVRVQQGRVKEAIDVFRRVADAGGPSLAADARLALAFALLSDGQADSARVELDVVRQRQPESLHATRAGYYLALLALRAGRIDEAAALCRAVIARAPLSDEAIESRTLLADLTASRSSTEQALADLRSAFTAEGGGAPMTAAQRGRLAKKLGDLASESGQPGQAIRWYEQARQWLPGRQAELDYQMASCYEEAGDTELAIRRYQAIGQAPWAVRGQLAAAKLLERQQQWPAARAVYEAIVRQPVPEAKIAEERLTALPGPNPAGSAAGGRR
jgi:tetratricopeptide (TPR) repeat protein